LELLEKLSGYLKAKENPAKISELKLDKLTKLQYNGLELLMIFKGALK
jgi:hypothetical protein